MLYPPRDTSGVLSGRVPSLLNYFGPGGLKAYWPFTGGSLIDQTGKGSNLTTYNSPYTRPGVLGRGLAYTFTGEQTSAAFLKASGTSAASFQSATAGSIAFWANVGTAPSLTAGFYEDMIGWGTSRFSVIYTTGGGIQAFVRTTVTAYSTTAYTVPLNQWFHVVATWSAARNELRLCINGKYQYYAATTGTTMDTTVASSPIHIGGRKTNETDDGFTRTIGGYMADVGVFNYALSLNEIAAYYNHCLREGSALVQSPVTKYFPSYYIAPPSALRQRASKTVPRLSDSRILSVGTTVRANTYWTLENSNLINYGKTNTVAGSATGITYTSCPILGGGAATFAGSNTSYISGGSNNVAIVDTGFLISFWIRWNNLTTGEYTDHGNMICGFNTSGVGTIWYFRFRNPTATAYASALESSAYNYSEGVWRSNFSPTMNVEVGVWYHFAAYIDIKNADNIRWYMNGNLIPGNTNQNGNFSSFSSPNTDFRLGWAMQGSTYASSIAGALREFQILNRYVHPQSVMAYYKAKIAQPTFQIPAIYTAKDYPRYRVNPINLSRARPKKSLKEFFGA